LTSYFIASSVGGHRGIVDVVLHRIEGAAQVHRHGKAGKLPDVGAPLALGAGHHRSLGDVVDGRIADVDVAAPRDAEERRLHVEVFVVRDAVLDREGRHELGEIGLLRLPGFLARVLR
jgi:hypothetical protein